VETSPPACFTTPTKGEVEEK